MRILIATGIYPPDIGGPATYASLLNEELPKRGIKVKIVTYGPSGVSRKIPKGLRHLVYFWLCLVKSSDVILTQDPVSSGLPALLAARLTGRKFIIRVPGDYVWEQATQRFGVKEGIDDFQLKKYGFKVEFLRWIQKFVTGSADLVITPSRYFQKLVSGWIKQPSKVQVIYNGIRLHERFLEPNKKNTKIMVSAGRLVPWKGFSFLIELMKDLPDWQLNIVGDGPEYDSLKSQVSRLGLADRVKLFGSISREKLFDLFNQAEIFVLNTGFESFSFQIVEAMSLGLPVVTTKVGNLDEIVDNGLNGFLLEPNNKKGFLDIIQRLDQDGILRKKISERAIVKAQKFSIQNTVDNLIIAFNKLI